MTIDFIHNPKKIALLALALSGLAFTAPALHAQDYDATPPEDEWSQPKNRKTAEIVFGAAGVGYSVGSYNCSYYYNTCVSNANFDIKSTFTPRLSFHLFPVRHFQINLSLEMPEPKATTTAQDAYGNNYEADLGKLKLRRLSVTALYRHPTRNFDFYLGGGLDGHFNTGFETDPQWLCLNPRPLPTDPGYPAACTLGDNVTAEAGTGFHLTMGVDIRMSRNVYFNIEGNGRSYDTTFTYRSKNGNVTQNTGLKLTDKVTEGSLAFGVGIRF
jgi:opacity protein-like surface antigen